MYSYNPIDLRIDDKQQEFESLQAFYLKVLELLWKDFPRGYIDYMVFLYDYTALRGTPLGECCRNIERGWVESQNFCINVHWTYHQQSRNKLTDLLRKMSRHVKGFCFDIRQFDNAWATFCRNTLDEVSALPQEANALPHEASALAS